MQTFMSLTTENRYKYRLNNIYSVRLETCLFLFWQIDWVFEGNYKCLLCLAFTLIDLRIRKDVTKYSNNYDITLQNQVY